MYTVRRTAYILQIHKNPNQVNKFISQLISEEQADVYIHIDKRSYDEIYPKIIKVPNVKILKQSIHCEWGDISQIDTTIMLLKEVLASKNEYDYVCLRSGQDLLVKNGFKDFLLEHKGNIFMNYRNVGKENIGLMMIKWPKVMRRRYTGVHPIRIFRRILLSLYGKGIKIFANKKSWPLQYSFYKGSQWFAVPFEVANYMVQFLDENEWYYQFFEDSLIPDESFFHTLIMNSPYKHKVVNNNLFFLKWGETLSERNSPQDLTKEDIQLIEQSEQFFARKFEEDIDNNVIEYFSEKAKFAKCRVENVEVGEKIRVVQS
ncbi:hypothetical protein KDN24_05345 [Bacillus sp. Bva_UNVM-123]|uniref:beta-1,6-N-acetylglucosaminyltransferase n=1 Tax=Bacillus sp. Bva_UNVM-123 TaxID=2829798 RepID=UPI00391F42EE